MSRCNIVVLTCFNTGCTNTIITTQNQMRELFEVMPLKYGIHVFPTCSKECAEKLLQQQGKYKNIIKKAEKSRKKMQDAR